MYINKAYHITVNLFSAILELEKFKGVFSMKKRILFSFAHPDDETFITGGILAKYSKRKDIETIVYSATLGDAGKCGNPPVCSKADLAMVRKNELENACHILGVTTVVTGTFKDGTLLDLPNDVLSDAVKQVVKTYQPNVVVTFPPHGISGHRDHIAMQKATLEAITSDVHTPVEKLYYVTLASESGKTFDGRRTVDDMNDVTLIINYTENEMEVVRKALLAHQTQHLSVERVFPMIHEQLPFSKYGNRECFILKWSKQHQSSAELLDLI